MSWIDLSIFAVYMLAMLGVGVFFMRKNKNTDDFYVGGRKLGSIHIGLSVAATDVGGGFSIGLGGLGFTMGLSGSWLLFSGLLGAWISAVILIPKVAEVARLKGFLSFPQWLGHIYNPGVARLAGIISAIGYLGFTSSQILAGAKLASSTFNGLSVVHAIYLMGIIAVVYTALGGLKAVIYTDTIQWIVLMAGLLFVGIPFAFHAVGGMSEVKASLQPELLKLNNVSWQTIVNWMFTILPIWFIGMTLYQRIYASKNTQTAQRGWFIAGLFEYPLMAFTGVILGMLARVAFENNMLAGYNSSTMDPEMGLPLLLKTMLPVGFLGIVLSAYFSAIMSTADSCLMASSGNVLTDVFKFSGKSRSNLLLSQFITLVLGTIALFLALRMTNVLDLMLHSYSFMVSGLIVPVLAGLFIQNPKSTAAIFAMVAGGSATIVLTTLDLSLPLGLDPIIFGIVLSFLVFIFTSVLSKSRTNSLNN